MLASGEAFGDLGDRVETAWHSSSLGGELAAALGIAAAGGPGVLRELGHDDVC